MTISESRPTISPGEPAPDFELPAVDASGTVSLADYRGRSPLFLFLFIGLWWPFLPPGNRPGRSDRTGAQGIGSRDARSCGRRAGERPALS